ncbi:MAG: DUF2975 domain-containing protein [Clostridia bacterium]|nr:DUF2975 domain-containing protein [Clostridia bacterium]
MKKNYCLTTICWGFTLSLIPVLAVLALVFPTLTTWYFTTYGESHVAETIQRLMIAFYICLPIGFVALGLLAKILHNLRKELVFIRQNAVCFRWLSFCALYVGFACTATGIVYLPLLIIALAAFFIGLLLQVLVRLLLTACQIADENSLTV